jgi:hypothetical protein
VVRVAVLLAAAALAAPAAAGPPTRLTLVRRTPVTVDGTGFRHLERVSVRLVAPGVDRTRRRRATRSGRLTVRFGVVVDRCSGLSVIASGAAGSRAVLRSRAQPLCPPP